MAQRVKHMRLSSIVLSLVVAAAAGFAAAPAQAQGFPNGSYQRSCTQLHWSGSTLVAECRRTDGRYTGTGLADAARCRSDIANIDGQLRCGGGAPPAAQGFPPPSGQGYAGPPPQEYAPPGSGYAPGYGSGPGYYGGDERRARCEELRHREHELRDRIAYAPYGEDRERLEYRLREVHEDRERAGCGG